MAVPIPIKEPRPCLIYAQIKYKAYKIEGLGNFILQSNTLTVSMLKEHVHLNDSLNYTKLQFWTHF